MAERREGATGTREIVHLRPWAHRDPQDDFVCLRFQVWYPSRDCAFRTKFKTAPGCDNCDQGRFNLKRHAADLRLVRARFAADEA